MQIMLTREIDHYTRDFISRHPEAVVVYIGCGLDSRFDRVAERNSQVEWYDLDLPEVIGLRRKLIGDEGGRQGTGDGIYLLGEWGCFDQPEPRMDSFRWMAPLFRLLKPMRIFHFQLGKAEA